MKWRTYAICIHETHVRCAYEIGQKFLQDNSKTSSFFFQTYNYKVYETATDRNFLDPYIYLSNSGGEKMENNLSTFLLL